MGLVRAISRHASVRRPFGHVAASYIRFVYGTGRWETLNGDTPASFWDRGKPFIGAFWHGRLLMMPCSWRPGVPIRVLISKRGDGPLIADIIRHFDLGTVRGSTTEGGATALRAMVKEIEDGAYGCITPDGPDGPRMRVSNGIISLARLTGVPILPSTFSTANRAILKGWDRLVLPRPFTKGVIIWGRPIYVPRQASKNEIRIARQTLELQLNAITDQADRLCGHKMPLAPEPVREVLSQPVPQED